VDRTVSRDLIMFYPLRRNSFAQTKTDRIPKRYASGINVPGSNCFPAMGLLGNARKPVVDRHLTVPCASHLKNVKSEAGNSILSPYSSPADQVHHDQDNCYDEKQVNQSTCDVSE